MDGGQPLEHLTGFVLIAAADTAQRRYVAILRRHGITIQDFMVLPAAKG
jgi:hypothetical protein